MDAEDKAANYVTIGSAVWVPKSDDKTTWRIGVITGREGSLFQVSFDDGRVVETVDSKHVLAANPEELFAAGFPDDIIRLSHLNEPSIHDLVEKRFVQKNKPEGIYTNAGPVLIAVNPCQALPIYNDEFQQTYIEAYKNVYKGSGTKIEDTHPHVFKVAALAYKRMAVESESQAIVVSGESGAGKTETTKKVLEFFSSLTGASELAKRLLKSNPILEAFGNAKTSRNPNSSRFGKLLNIRFRPTPGSRNPRIVSASMATYLLEKSRVVGPAAGERNYHSFHMMLRGASEAERKMWHLPEAKEKAPAQKFRYLKNGVENVPERKDVEDWQEMREAMADIGMSDEDQQALFSLLAGCLWLGNVLFVAGGNDEALVDPKTDDAFSHAAELLGLELEDLRTALTKAKFGGRGGIAQMHKQLSTSAAEVARDSLAKAVYGSLFDYIVGLINERMGADDTSSDPDDKIIAVLDIFGFEHFQVNSFEQLCINYANERLQQLFCRHLFKKEQAEYQAEGLGLAMYTYSDNDDTIQLLDATNGKQGIFSLLNEGCIMPNSDDGKVAEFLRGEHKDHVCFHAPPTRRQAFQVRHFADTVEYSMDGMLEKNKDALSSDLMEAMAGSSSSLLSGWGQGLLDAAAEAGKKPGARGKKALLVGFRFKQQVDDLISTLETAYPHFVRCVKPNKELKPGRMDADMVMAQLRCAGILAVANIYKKGFPTRYLREEFLSRYNDRSDTVGKALIQRVQGADPIAVCHEVLQRVMGLELEKDYVMGKTMVFFRAGRLAKVEDTWARRLRAADIITNWCHIRKMRILFKKYVKESFAAIKIQKQFRTFRRRKLLKTMSKVMTDIHEQFMERARQAERERELAALAAKEAARLAAEEANKGESEAATVAAAAAEAAETARLKAVLKAELAAKELAAANQAAKQAAVKKLVTVTRVIEVGHRLAKIARAKGRAAAALRAETLSNNLGGRGSGRILTPTNSIPEVVAVAEVATLTVEDDDGAPENTTWLSRLQRHEFFVQIHHLRMEFFGEVANELDRNAMSLNDNINALLLNPELERGQRMFVLAADVREQLDNFTKTYETKLMDARRKVRQAMFARDRSEADGQRELKQLSELRDKYYLPFKSRFNDILEEMEPVDLPEPEPQRPPVRAKSIWGWS